MAENKNEATGKQEEKKSQGKCGCGCKPPVKK